MLFVTGSLVGGGRRSGGRSGMEGPSGLTHVCLQPLTGRGLVSPPLRSRAAPRVRLGGRDLVLPRAGDPLRLRGLRVSCGSLGLRAYAGRVRRWQVPQVDRRCEDLVGDHLLDGLAAAVGGTPEGSVCQAWPLWPKEHPKSMPAWRFSPGCCPGSRQGVRQRPRPWRMLTCTRSGSTLAAALRGLCQRPTGCGLGLATAILGGFSVGRCRRRSSVGYRAILLCSLGRRSGALSAWRSPAAALRPRRSWTPSSSWRVILVSGRGRPSRVGSPWPRPCRCRACRLGSAPSWMSTRTASVNSPSCRSFLVLCFGVFLKFSARGPVRPVLCSQ